MRLEVKSRRIEMHPRRTGRACIALPETLTVYGVGVYCEKR